MLRLYHILLGLIFIPVGIGTATSYFSSDKKSESNSLKTPTPKTTLVSAKSNSTNIWQNLIQDTQLPPGWKMNSCENSNSLLCVSANGKRLGAVEMEIFPLETQLNFKTMLLNAGIPTSSNIDYQSPKHLKQVTKALNAWVENYYKLLAKSRKYVFDNKSKTTKKADDILFSPYPTQKIRVGRLEGISYGFAGIKEEGELYEQHIGYVAFDGKALYLINTAFNSGSSTGSFDKLEDFSVFQPYLNAVVANLKLTE